MLCAVSIESFAAWRVAFEKEMESNHEPHVGITLDPARRKNAVLSGREQFLMASASTLEDNDDDGDIDEEATDDRNDGNDAGDGNEAIDATVFQAVQENLDELEFSDEDDE